MNLLENIAVVVLGIITGIIVNHLSNNLPYLRSGYRLDNPICLWCKNIISWRTFVFLFKCPHCQRLPKLRIWLVLWGYPALFLILRHIPPQRMDWWMGAITMVYFSLVAVMDLEHRAILNSISLIGVLLGIGVGWSMHGLLKTLLGGIAGYLMMFVLYYLGTVFSRLVSKVRNQPMDEVALGFGDVNLSGVMGLFLGWPGITAGLLLAIILGGGFSLLIIIYRLITHKYQMFMAIPYAPFLLIGATLLLFRP